MAAVAPALSQSPLRSSPDKWLPSLIGFRSRRVRFEPKLAAARGIGWKNCEKSTVWREQVRKKEAVRCTAEGVEKGMLMGGIGGETKITVPARFKVVTLLALVMCLCNADRVVMSVAIVPLAARNGWSSSFLGIVQVPIPSYLHI